MLARYMADPMPSTDLKASAPLRGVRACVFDAYGTLFDFASAARQCRDVLGDGVDRLTALWRDKQLQYTWLRAAQGRHADFWEVTGDALDFSLDALNLKSAGLREPFDVTLSRARPVPGGEGSSCYLKGDRFTHRDPVERLSCHA
jgi:2-haloacid dehalogenase